MPSRCWCRTPSRACALGRAFRDGLRAHTDRHGEAPRLVYLGNHGIVALGDSAQQVRQITAMAVKAARVLAGLLALGSPAFLDPDTVRRLDTRADERHRRAVLARSSARRPVNEARPAVPRRRRAEALGEAAAGVHDVVVVGGGVTGAGVALDAAHAGLSVVLLEAGDLAGGTSSRSGKTVHGGLRYLEQLNFSLVAGALRERDLMIAPAGAAPGDSPSRSCSRSPRTGSAPYIGAGVALYDAMAAAGEWRSAHRRGGVPHHRHLTRRGALRVAPGLAPRRHHRRAAVLRRPHGRRPAHPGRGPHGQRVRRHVVSRARVVDVLTASTAG